MLFNSIDFAIFLPLVFLLYWFLLNKRLRLQNLLIVIASYFFYAWWDWRFLSLIVFSTGIDYLVGLKLKNEKNKLKRKALLWTSILVNLGLLGFFKYYNFFIENFETAFSFFGMQIQTNSLNIILPIGISFYTFQTISYTIDVYRRKIEATNDIIAFSAFVCFFPQLLAGPIERAKNFLPQFYIKREFNFSQAVDGMHQILWGLFKKIVIADSCARHANEIFNNSSEYNGSTLVMGAVFFAFQIYGDFSGYSDIAIGTSRLFGFNLKQNFAFPYFSRDIAEFWRRWHISLSSWFKDYLYIPLGGNRNGSYKTIRNVFILFVVSGFWHGANWTFIIWGVLNAFYYLPIMLVGKNRNHLIIVASRKKLPTIKELIMMLLTFVMTTFGWIFFRAENIHHAFSYISEIFSSSLFDIPDFLDLKKVIVTICLLLFFTVLEWIGREKQHPLQYIIMKWNRASRYSLYYLIVFMILWFAGKEQQFIYFQF